MHPTGGLETKKVPPQQSAEKLPLAKLNSEGAFENKDTEIGIGCASAAEDSVLTVQG
jgi:hypothetical protein